MITDADHKRIAAAAQERALTIGTHAVLGEYFQPVAARKNLTGYVNAPVYVYWNLDKKQRRQILPKLFSYPRQWPCCGLITANTCATIARSLNAPLTSSNRLFR